MTDIQEAAVAALATSRH